MTRMETLDGLKIYIFADDHPLPHVHVYFAEYQASIEIDSLKQKGKLPKKIAKKAKKWIEKNQNNLNQEWRDLNGKSED